MENVSKYVKLTKIKNDAIMEDIERKMPEMFKKVNASEFFNTILEDRLNRNKSKVLMKNNQESVHNG